MKQFGIQLHPTCLSNSRYVVGWSWVLNCFMVSSLPVIYSCSICVHMRCTSNATIFHPVLPPHQPSPPQSLPPPLLPQDQGLLVLGKVSRDVGVECVRRISSRINYFLWEGGVHCLKCALGVLFMLTSMGI